MHKPPFELRILGHTEFSGPVPEGTESVVRQPKRLALVAYLAIVTADGFTRRDQITAFFWPELDQSQARTYLRKALYGIREALADDLFPTRGEDELRLDPTRLWCDAVALKQCIRERQWSDALSLYRGELLEGLFPEGVAQEFEEWLSRQRTALRQEAAHAAWECSRLEEERGDRTAAAVMARRARELDPDNEEGVRRLMGLLDRRGDRGGALRVYTEWRARLAEEFGVEPDPETRKLARRVQASRKGESHEASPVQVPVAFAESSSATSPEDVTAARVPTPARSTRRNWFPYVGIGVLVGVLVGVGVAFTRLPRFSGEANSIAVLPLRPIGDSALRVLAESIAEEMTTALARDSNLIVRSAPRVLDLRYSGDAIRTGRELAVAYLVDGGVQRSTGKVRVTLRVTATQNAVTVWAASFEADSIESGVLGQRVGSEATAAISSIIAGSRAMETKVRR